MPNCCTGSGGALVAGLFAAVVGSSAVAGEVECSTDAGTCRIITVDVTWKTTLCSCADCGLTTGVYDRSSHPDVEPQTEPTDVECFQAIRYWCRDEAVTEPSDACTEAQEALCLGELHDHLKACGGLTNRTEDLCITAACCRWAERRGFARLEDYAACVEPYGLNCSEAAAECEEIVFPKGGTGSGGWGNASEEEDTETQEGCEALPASALGAALVPWFGLRGRGKRRRQARS